MHRCGITSDSIRCNPFASLGMELSVVSSTKIVAAKGGRVHNGAEHSVMFPDRPL